MPEITCPRCEGYWAGTFPNTYLCTRCKDTGKLEISDEDLKVLKEHENLQRVLNKYTYKE